MSRTTRRRKPIGYDFWSRRCFGNMCIGYGPVSKWITKRKERTHEKKNIKQAINDPDNYIGRTPGD
jgi:hypothetical protein